MPISPKQWDEDLLIPTMFPLVLNFLGRLNLYLYEEYIVNFPINLVYHSMLRETHVIWR